MATSVVLTIRDGTRAGEQFEFDADGEYTIGRGKDCAVNLSDGPESLTVSRRHCLVKFDLPNSCVRDLGSRNGTYLNGMQIGQPDQCHLPPQLRHAPCADHALSDGDELGVGPTIFLVGIHDDEREHMASENQLLCAGV
jgi:pSer/pThr/pTyr-binding forkhead associated (FHA) protein